MALTNAQRQRRYRERRTAQQPRLHYRRPQDRLATQQDAVRTLLDLQDEYAWRPPRQSRGVCARTQAAAICALDLELDSALGRSVRQALTWQRSGPWGRYAADRDSTVAAAGAPTLSEAPAVRNPCAAPTLLSPCSSRLAMASKPRRRGGLRGTGVSRYSLPWSLHRFRLRCSKQSRFFRRVLSILPPSPLSATAHLQPLHNQPVTLGLPSLILIVARSSCARQRRVSVDRPV